MKASSITGCEYDTWESLYWTQREINNRQSEEIMEVSNNLTISEAVKEVSLKLSATLRSQIVHLETRLEKLIAINHRRLS